MVEGEAGVGLERRRATSPVRAVDEREARAALGLPAVVLDVRPARQRERERVDDERELGQHEPALGEAERVHVGRLLDRQRADHPRLARRRGSTREEAVAAARAELGGVVEHRAGAAVAVRVGGRQLAGRPRTAARRPSPACAGRTATGIGVSVIAMKRSPSLVTLMLALSGSVAGANMRLHALEQRAAGVGRELAVDDLALLAARRGRRGSAGSGCRRRPCRRRS